MVVVVVTAHQHLQQQHLQELTATTLEAAVVAAGVTKAKAAVKAAVAVEVNRMAQLQLVKLALQTLVAAAVAVVKAVLLVRLVVQE